MSALARSGKFLRSRMKGLVSSSGSGWGRTPTERCWGWDHLLWWLWVSGRRLWTWFCCSKASGTYWTPLPWIRWPWACKQQTQVVRLRVEFMTVRKWGKMIDRKSLHLRRQWATINHMENKVNSDIWTFKSQRILKSWWQNRIYHLQWLKLMILITISLVSRNYHFIAWSAIPKSPWGIQRSSQVTNQPSFISFFYFFFSPPTTVMASRPWTKRGLCQRDPLLALMRGPGRRGTPGLVRACLNLLRRHHFAWPLRFYSCREEQEEMLISQINGD